MSQQSHTIETRIEAVSVKEGKQPSIKVNLFGAPVWLTQSLPQYFSGTPATAVNQGDAVRITYNNDKNGEPAFLSMMQVLEPFVATSEDMGPPSATWDETAKMPGPLRHDPMRQSIERQTCAKVAGEVMSALIVANRVPVGTPMDVIQTVAAMAMSLAAAIEE